MNSVEQAAKDFWASKNIAVKIHIDSFVEGALWLLNEAAKLSKPVYGDGNITAAGSVGLGEIKYHTLKYEDLKSLFN